MVINHGYDLELQVESIIITCVFEGTKHYPLHLNMLSRIFKVLCVGGMIPYALNEFNSIESMNVSDIKVYHTYTLMFDDARMDEKIESSKANEQESIIRI